MQTAKIIHCHGAITDTFIELLNITHPSVADWFILPGHIQKNQTRFSEY